MNNNTNNNQNEREKMKMELWMKILLGLAGVASIGAIVFGIATYQTAKENEIKDATVGSTIIEVQDNTQSNNETEQIVDKNLQYQEEAEKLWTAYNDKLVCTENQFISEYVNYRNNGLTEKQAWTTLYNAYGKEFQSETVEPSQMDAVINSYDDNTEEEVAEPVDNVIVEFEVIELDQPETLYATQTVNLRQGPSANDFEKIGSLSARQQVTVVGIVEQYKGETVLWYKLDTGEYCSGAYLVKQLPAESNQQQTSQGSTGQQSSGQQNGGNTGGFNFEGASSQAPTWNDNQTNLDHGVSVDVPDFH